MTAAGSPEAEVVLQATSQSEGLVDVSASSLRFAYPFTFDASRFDSRVGAFERATFAGARHPLKVWRSKTFATDDLLAPVADFIAPPPDIPPTARFWQMEDQALSSPGGLGGGRRNPGARWVLLVRQKEIPFLIQAMQLALFRHGVGVLTVTASPVAPDCNQWFDFLHHFRFAAGRRAPRVTATRVTGIDAGSGESERVPFFPRFDGNVAGGTEPNEVRRFGGIVTGLLETAGCDEDAGQWWEDIFVPGMLVPFASLFIDGRVTDKTEIALYRLRNFFHANQPVEPSDEDIRADHPLLLHYAARQWFFFSVNGGGFLAWNPPQLPFFRSTLPAHLTEEYFLLFLLALHQRFVLMRLSRHVFREWARSNEDQESDRARAFAAIRDQFLAFTAQGYFVQTMQEEHHHRCYERWKRTFQLTELYEQVGSEVREIDQYLHTRLAEAQAERAAHLDRRLALAAWMLGLPTLLFLMLHAASFFSAIRAIFGANENIHSALDLLLAASVLAGGLIFAYALYRLASIRSQFTRTNDRATPLGPRKR